MAICYSIVNGLCVFLPFIPGMVTFIAWGFILPLLFLGGSWVVVARQRQSIRTWWIVGLISTGAYAGMGFLSVYIIGAMWASV